MTVDTSSATSRRLTFVAAVVALSATFSFSPSPVEAGIVSVFGDAAEIAPPGSVVLGALEDDELAKIFVERAGTVLGSDLTVDITAPSSVDEAADLTPGSISAGSRVDSYYVHFDPAAPTGTASASVTFDRDILGILVVTSSLDASDAGLGAPATTYQLNDFRGIEGPGFDTMGPGIDDRVSLLPDLRTVRFEFATAGRLDQIRVVTAAAPTPSTAALVVLALGILHRNRRRNSL